MNWPRLGVGGIVIHNGRVALVRRANPPFIGEWTVPGGRVEAGETIAEAVERELLEETGLIVRAGELIYHFEHIEYGANGELRYHYVVLDLLAELVGGELRAASDAAEAAWLSRQQIDDSKINPITRAVLTKVKAW
jgi:8-oxo-dGTP diphosphatase